MEVFLHATGARRPAAAAKRTKAADGEGKKVTKEAQAKSRRKR